MQYTTTSGTSGEPTSPAPISLASRRGWLKGLGALLGSGLLAAPAAALAATRPDAPAAPAAEPLAASALVGGDEYIGIVKLLATDTVPAGWALCHGQLLAVAEHPALFAIVGSHYGGDGRTTFALPDLRESGVPPVAPGTPVPAQLCAIKIANAAATTTGGCELRLRHHHRARTSQAA